jgi:hypothetical protein
MAEWAAARARGAEISERSAEWLLPEQTASESPKRLHERKIGVSNSEAPYGQETAGAQPAASNEPIGDRIREAERAVDSLAPLKTSGIETQNTTEKRGLSLPGDRGRVSPAVPKQRPSFWRRIALGRRGPKNADANSQQSAQQNAQPSARPSDTPIARNSAPVKTAHAVHPVDRGSADSIEKRVVEPMLQALVSVESKLERSHVELIGRSDQVEQRLTQLWDIEEQLGTLGELQESLLQISEQQRRLESAFANQNKTLNWLVGAILFSLATAAFFVAAVLR